MHFLKMNLVYTILIVLFTLVICTPLIGKIWRYFKLVGNRNGGVVNISDVAVSR